MAAACDAGDAPASGTASRDSAGIRIVENRRPALAEPDACRIEPEPVLEIGVVQGVPASSRG